jgi:ABC-type lipoprotein export system ATPase subunit
MKGFKRDDKYIYESKEYKIIDDVENNDFTPLINLVIDSKESYNILGPTGSGKTTLINNLKSKLTEMNIELNLLAPTNKAALLIDGTTSNKFVKK